jgi:putative transposase
VQLGHQQPSRNTIVSRIRRIDTKTVVTKRDGYQAASQFRPAAGKTPEPSSALELVQIDHSPMDLIVVEENSRAPIGRPSLTLAIDVHTRCIVGLLLTLEAPSATSVGLCLANVVANKQAYLERVGLPDVEWPMYGKPSKIHVDNAPEFHSDALKRGCEQHGIKRDYRPKKQPHFGGIIERVIGTAMKMCHELPGTTFSNVQERGKYNSAKAAVLTLHELEKWLVLAIANYHGSVHDTLKTTPLSYWKKSIRTVCSVRDEKSFLVDFLPVIERTVRRTGFVIDHITYYSDVLKPWIAKRDRMGKFIIRRDPRDLSRVWVLDPPTNEYIELPYRSISNPAVTLWEHRKAVEMLRENGRNDIDENALFRTIERMRQIVDQAEEKSRRARREKARRSHLSQAAKPKTISLPKFGTSRTKVKPFDDIEEW